MIANQPRATPVLVETTLVVLVRPTRSVLTNSIVPAVRIAAAPRPMSILPRIRVFVTPASRRGPRVKMRKGLKKGKRKNCYVGLGTHVPIHEGRSRQELGIP